MLEASKVSVHYRGGDAAALDGVSLRVDAGEIVSLVGANGSGKSTLGALLCAMRLPDTGSVTVDGADPARSAADRREMRRRVGLVRQHPFDQLVSTVVFDEVAFGPRNLGLDRDAVRARVDRALARVGLDGLERRDTTALSGGEQQRLALAGVLAMEPSYIVLDEASSMLDASARPRCRALVAELAASDIGIVQITHDPLEILSSRRVVVLDTGRVAFEGTPLDLLFDHADLWDGTIVSHPAVEALRYACGRGFHPSGTPTPQAAVSWLLEGYRASRIDRADIAHALTCCEGRVAGGVRRDACPENANPVIAIDGVSYSYDGRERVLRDVSLDLRAGEVALIAGTSGSGKSTLACIAAGLIASDAGTVAVCGAAPRPGDVGMAFQRPEDQLFCESVADEISAAMGRRSPPACGVRRVSSGSTTRSWIAIRSSCPADRRAGSRSARCCPSMPPLTSSMSRRQDSMRPVAPTCMCSPEASPTPDVRSPSSATTWRNGWVWSIASSSCAMVVSSGAARRVRFTKMPMRSMLPGWMRRFRSSSRAP